MGNTFSGKKKLNIQKYLRLPIKSRQKDFENMDVLRENDFATLGIVEIVQRLTDEMISGNGINHSVWVELAINYLSPDSSNLDNLRQNKGKICEILLKPLKAEPGENGDLHNYNGMILHAQGKKEEALEFFINATQLQSPLGTYNLGQHLRTKDGYPHLDGKGTREILKRAEQMGDINATEALAYGGSFSANINYEIVELAKRKIGACASNAAGCTYLHNRYRAPNTKNSALIWFRQGAQLGLPTSMRNLSGILREAGVNRDLPLAIAWLNKAAIYGDELSLQELPKVLSEVPRKDTINVAQELQQKLERKEKHPLIDAWIVRNLVEPVVAVSTVNSEHEPTIPTDTSADRSTFDSSKPIVSTMKLNQVK